MSESTLAFDKWKEENQGCIEDKELFMCIYNSRQQEIDELKFKCECKTKFLEEAAKDNDALKAQVEHNKAAYSWAHIEAFGEDTLDRDMFNTFLAAHDAKVKDRLLMIVREHKARYRRLQDYAIITCMHTEDCDCGEYEQGHITAMNMIMIMLELNGE